MKVSKSLLGSGTYGTVYKGFDSQGNEVAIKCFRKEDDDEGIAVGTLREIVYLKNLPPHPNVIELGEVEFYGKSKDKIRVTMPLYPMDLSNYMKEERNNKPFTNKDEVIGFSRQILSALHHLHRHGVMHRDLKPSNILIDIKTQQLVLCDFSLASSFVSKLNHSITVQTLWYRAIEILLGEKKYNAKIDIWSFGCVLGLLLTGNHILQGDCDYGQIMCTFQMFGTPTNDLWPNITQLQHYRNDWPKFKPKKIQWGEDINCKAISDLFYSSTTYHPEKRCSAEQALKYIS